MPKHTPLLLITLLTFLLSSKASLNILGLQTSVLNRSKILSLINVKRLEVGVSPLKENHLLNSIAATKAAQLNSTNTWSHTVNGEEPWMLLSRLGYDYSFAGENLARNYQNEAQVVEAWLNSPAHKANMLNPNYEETGMAIENGVVVQLFATPMTNNNLNFSPQFLSTDFLSPVFNLFSPLNYLLLLLCLLVIYFYQKNLNHPKPTLKSQLWRSF